MSERTPLIAGNWKMHKTRLEAGEFLEVLLADGAPEGIDVAVCPPFTALEVAIERCAGSRVTVAAQNVHSQPEGAFTGEVSVPMLAELGAWGAILGHSERRQLFGETDDALALKVPTVLEGELVPILCVGETEAQRDAGETEEVLGRQVEADLAQVPDDALARVVIAYEPIWAIGTGRTATADQAEEAIAHIRGLIAERDGEAAAAIRVLYGGSVKPGNAAELLGRDGIDGALVGGASLDPEDFLAICAAAR